MPGSDDQRLLLESRLLLIFWLLQSLATGANVSTSKGIFPNAFHPVD